MPGVAAGGRAEGESSTVYRPRHGEDHGLFPGYRLRQNDQRDSNEEEQEEDVQVTAQPPIQKTEQVPERFSAVTFFGQVFHTTLIGPGLDPGSLLYFVMQSNSREKKTNILSV